MCPAALGMICWYCVNERMEELIKKFFGNKDRIGKRGERKKWSLYDVERINGGEKGGGEMKLIQKGGLRVLGSRQNWKE